MGLFTRRDDDSPTADGASPSAGDSAWFSHAAFAPADVADARRGHPAVSLQAFATANGLDYRDRSLSARFMSVQPRWPDYTFNVCRGALPVGRLGQVSHELLELETAEGSIRSGGTFYDVRITTRRSARDMLNLGDGDPENAPFVGNSAWLPTTAVHVRVPEVNQLPEFTVRRSGETIFGGRKLDGQGLPGFHLRRGPEDDDAFLHSIGVALGPGLTTRPDAYVDLRSGYGLVALTVNGYRSDDADLRHLLDVAGYAAQTLAALALPADPAGFDAPGPVAGTVPTPEWVPRPHPSYTPVYAQAATELELVNEAPHHLSLVLPACPVPGIASGVLFGTLPGTATLGRLVWFEHGSRYSGAVRGGVIAQASPGATTPLGGIAHEPTGNCVEVVDGFAHCWKVDLFTGRLESRQLTPDARAAFAATDTATI